MKSLKTFYLFRFKIIFPRPGKRRLEEENEIKDPLVTISRYEEPWKIISLM